MDQPTTVDETVELIRKDLANIELDVTTEGWTLADAIREADKYTQQEVGGWGNGITTACALSSAYLDARARGLVE